MFSQQVTNYNQDLGVTMTSPMQMNWLLRTQAYAWYFLPPITSILILWWYALFLADLLLVLYAVLHCTHLMMVLSTLCDLCCYAV